MTIRALTAATVAGIIFAGCQGEPTGPPAVDGGRLLAEYQTSRADATPLPFWSRILCCLEEGGGIVFYVTDPSAVPADFNLLQFFDPRALGAESSVEGFMLIEDGALTPRKVDLKGLGAVPIWFFDAAQWQGMFADGVVTVPEMEANGPIKGHATFYREILQPAGGGAPRTGLHVKARGTLEEGGSFTYQVEAPNPPFLPTNGRLVLDR